MFLFYKTPRNPCNFAVQNNGSFHEGAILGWNTLSDVQMNNNWSVQEKTTMNAPAKCELKPIKNQHIFCPKNQLVPGDRGR